MSEFVKLPSGRIINVSQIASVDPLTEDYSGQPTVIINYPGFTEVSGSTWLRDADIAAFQSYMSSRTIDAQEATHAQSQLPSSPDSHPAAVARPGGAGDVSVDAGTHAADGTPGLMGRLRVQIYLAILAIGERHYGNATTLLSDALTMIDAAEVEAGA